MRIKPGAAGRFRWSLHTSRNPRSLAAMARLLWHDFAIHVPFEGSERCQDCGRAYVAWHAPDGLYAEVHGSPCGLLCPACFANAAARKGIVVVFDARVQRRIDACESRVRR